MRRREHSPEKIALERFSDALHAPQLSPPLPPLRKGGKVGGVWSFSPLAKGGYRGVLRVPLRCARFAIQAIENRSNESRRQEMVFPNRSSNRGGRRRGGAATELAVWLPLLVFVLIVAIDFCRLFFSYTIITNAARNGALCAIAPTQSPYNSVQDAALADANDLSPAPTVLPPTYGTDGQGNQTVSVTVQYQFNMISTYLGFSNVPLSRQVTMRMAP